MAQEKVLEKLNPLEDDGISENEELETRKDTDME